MESGCQLTSAGPTHHQGNTLFCQDNCAVASSRRLCLFQGNLQAHGLQEWRHSSAVPQSPRILSQASGPQVSSQIHHAVVIALPRCFPQNGKPCAAVVNVSAVLQQKTLRQGGLSIICSLDIMLIVCYLSLKCCSALSEWWLLLINAAFFVQDVPVWPRASKPLFPPWRVEAKKRIGIQEEKEIKIYIIT